MRWLLLAVVLLVAVAAIAATVLLDEETLRAHLETATAEALGTDVIIEGDVGLGLFPRPHVRAERVRLELNGDYLAAFDRARAHLKTRPLLRGEVRLRRLHLQGADILITRDEEGRLNLADADPVPDEEGHMPQVDFSAVTLRYGDELTGLQARLTACEGEVRAASPPDGRAMPPRERLEGEFGARCETLLVNDFGLADFEIEGKMDADNLSFPVLAARAFGTYVRGELHGSFADEVPHWTMALSMEELELSTFMQSWEPEAVVEGTINFELDLWSRGSDWETIEREVHGTISLHGTVLRLHGVDLDQRLSDLEGARELGLADIGAVLLAGPAGLAVTRGAALAPLLLGDEGESTEFREVLTAWTLEHGVARADDVAIATENYRLAALGKVDLSANRFDDFRIALLDGRGCAEMEQRISGPLDDPEIEEPGVAEMLLAPLTDLAEDVVEAVTGNECEIVYDGAVTAP